MEKQIITIPDELLRLKSKRIGYVDDSIRQLAEDMAVTARAWDRDSEIGAAIAAIQVGEPIKMTAIRNNFDDHNDKTFTTFINPSIVKSSPDMVTDIEGCLSVPGIYGRVARHRKIKVKAYNLDMREIRLTLEGFPARLFQHEIDHMHGIIFLDHITDSHDLLQIDKNGHLRPVNAKQATDLEASSKHGHVKD